MRGRKHRTGYDIVRPSQALRGVVPPDENISAARHPRSGYRLVRMAHGQQPDKLVAILGGAFGCNGTFGSHGFAYRQGNRWVSLIGNDSFVPTDYGTMEVFDFAIFQDAVYIVGELGLPGGLCQVAKWVGTLGANPVGDWEAVNGHGLSAGRACVVWQDQLIVCGGADSRVVASWDGSNWSDLSGTDMPTVGTGDDLAIYGDDLVMVGGFDVGASPGTWSGIAVYDGSSWNNIGDLTYGNGAAAAVGNVAYVGSNGTDLYVGGNFEEADLVECNNIARYDGSWHALDTGIPVGGPGAGWVSAIADHGGIVYATTFNGDGAPMSKFEGGSWSGVGENLDGAGARACTWDDEAERVLIAGAWAFQDRTYTDPEEKDYENVPLGNLASYDPETDKYSDELGGGIKWVLDSGGGLATGLATQIRYDTLPGDSSPRLMMTGPYNVSTGHCWNVVGVKNRGYLPFGYGVDQSLAVDLIDGVHDVHKLGARRFLFVGTFSNAINRDEPEESPPRVPSSFVVLWDDGEYQAAGTGVPFEAFAITSFNGKLWVVGVTMGPHWSNDEGANFTEQSATIDVTAGVMFDVCTDAAGTLLHFAGNVFTIGGSANACYGTLTTGGTAAPEILSDFDVIRTLAPHPSTDVDDPDYNTVYFGYGDTPGNAVRRRLNGGGFEDVGTITGACLGLAWCNFGSEGLLLVAVGALVVGVDTYNLAYWDGADWTGVEIALSPGGTFRCVGAVRFRGKVWAFCGGQYESVDELLIKNLSMWRPDEGVQEVPIGGVNGRIVSVTGV